MGGYTTVAWRSVNNYFVDKNAFLFSAETMTQLPILPSGNYAIYDHTSYGPTFGNGHDLYVASNSNSNSNSYSNLGAAY